MFDVVPDIFIRRGIGNRKHASCVVSINSSIKNHLKFGVRTRGLGLSLLDEMENLFLSYWARLGWSAPCTGAQHPSENTE
jgi:hypothetical protein